MINFAAIDFETANGKRTSVCSVGVVIVREGKITNKIYRLIRPRPNYYTQWTTAVHGLTYDDTMEADEFPEVWAEIKPLIGGLPLVAHNSPFDEGCLRAVHELYDMTYPDYKFYCTCRTSRKAGIEESLWKRFAQSSVAYGSRTMRISFRESPPRTGRCRGLRTNSFTYYSRTEKSKKNKES